MTHNKNVILCQNEKRKKANQNQDLFFEDFTAYAPLFEPFKTLQTKTFTRLIFFLYFLLSSFVYFTFRQDVYIWYGWWVSDLNYQFAWLIWDTWGILLSDSLIRKDVHIKFTQAFGAESVSTMNHDPRNVGLRVIVFLA